MRNEKKVTINYGSETIQCTNCGSTSVKKIEEPSTYYCNICKATFSMEIKKSEIHEAFTADDYLKRAINSLKLKKNKEALQEIEEAYICDDKNIKVNFYLNMLNYSINKEIKSLEKLQNYFKTHLIIENFEEEYLSLNVVDIYFYLNFDGNGKYNNFINKKRCELFLKYRPNLSSLYGTRTLNGDNWFLDGIFFCKEKDTYQYHSIEQIEFLLDNGCKENVDPYRECFKDVSLYEYAEGVFIDENFHQGPISYSEINTYLNNGKHKHKQHMYPNRLKNMNIVRLIDKYYTEKSYSTTYDYHLDYGDRNLDQDIENINNQINILENTVNKEKEEYSSTYNQYEKNKKALKKLKGSKYILWGTVIIAILMLVAILFM